MISITSAKKKTIALHGKIKPFYPETKNQSDLK
jgi:hypothetical protein